MYFSYASSGGLKGAQIACSLHMCVLFVWAQHPSYAGGCECADDGCQGAALALRLRAVCTQGEVCMEGMLQNGVDIHFRGCNWHSDCVQLAFKVRHLWCLDVLHQSGGHTGGCASRAGVHHAEAVTET